MRQLINFMLAALLFSAAAPCLGDESDNPAVIMIMIDGARPDLVEKMAQEGKLPNIKRQFIDGGTVYPNTFTSHALTVPSWTQILTGFDIDRTGIKGNDVFDRQSKKIENYLDWRHDIVRGDYRAHGRAYRKLHEMGHRTLMDRLYTGNSFAENGMIRDMENDDNAFFSFIPVNNKFPLYLFGPSIDNLLFFDVAKWTGFQNAAIRFLFDYNGFSALDRSSVDQVTKTLYDKTSPKRKLIGLYLTGADHGFHLEPGLGRQALMEADFNVGRIFKAMEETRYRNSFVFLVSDHGSLGGSEPLGNNLYNPLRGEEYVLTQTNLSQLFSGNFYMPGYNDYNFNVEASFASEGKFSLRNFSEFQLHPFQCTNVARYLRDKYPTCADFVDEHPEGITASVSTSQTVSLPYKSRLSGDWITPNNFYTLTHYQIGLDSQGNSIEKNIVKDLERLQIDHLMERKPRVAQKIGHRPLDWLALRIAAEDFNRSAVAHELGLEAYFPVILVHQSDTSQALILEHMDTRGKQTYRYIPIKDFNQKATGEVSFALDTRSDPFGYLGNPGADWSATGEMIDDSKWFSEYHSDRDWAARYSNTAFPNTVSALSRFMGFRGTMKEQENKLRADIYLNPRYGHFFNISNDVNHAQHGMWQRESVNILFMMAGPGILQSNRVSAPAFATDIVPTVLATMQKAGTIPKERVSAWTDNNSEEEDRMDGQAMTKQFQSLR